MHDLLYLDVEGQDEAERWPCMHGRGWVHGLLYLDVEDPRAGQVDPELVLDPRLLVHRDDDVARPPLRLLGRNVADLLGARRRLGLDLEQPDGGGGCGTRPCNSLLAIK